MFISVTDLASYLYCRRRLYSDKVLGIKEPPNGQMILGRVKHEVFDTINKADEQIVSSISEGLGLGEVKSSFLQAYSGIMEESIMKNASLLQSFSLNAEEALLFMQPLIEVEAGERAGNVFMFASQNSVYGAELWEQLVPKIKTELRLKSEVLKLVGVIDKVEMYADSMVPHELKSGSAPRNGVWKAHSIQVGAYAMLLRECFGTKVNSGFVKYLSLNELRPVRMNAFLEEEVKELTAAVLKLMELPKMPEERCKFSNCTACK